MAVRVAMVLAAGYGSRLRPLTDELPKPLVPLGDRSVLDHVAAAIARAGIERIVINAHHHAEALSAAAERLGLAGVSLEPTILGTAGGLSRACDLLGPGPVLVHNGDIVADLELRRLLEGWTKSEPFALLAVEGGLPPGEGNVGLVGARVVRLRDQRFGQEREGARFVGVQVLSAAARAAGVPRGCLVSDVYLPALARGEVLEAASLVRHFDDVGTPAAYLAANLRWLGARSHYASGVVIPEGVSLRQTVIGAGAQVVGRGRIERTVVWPGALVRAPLSDAIVTPRQLVRLTTTPETTSLRS